MPACQAAAERRSHQPQPDRRPAEPRRQDAPRTPGALSLAEFWARVDARD